MQLSLQYPSFIAPSSQMKFAHFFICQLYIFEPIIQIIQRKYIKCLVDCCSLFLIKRIFIITIFGFAINKKLLSKLKIYTFFDFSY